jgi:hypothetical protein
VIPVVLLFAASISMPDIDGVARTPFEPQGKASVLFFLATDCPISNSYAPEVQRICAEYSPKGVGCNLVYVDPDPTAADVRKHLTEFRYAGVPAILDPAHKLAGAAGAKVTPEAAVIGAGGKVLYRGRIDNLYASLGKRRPAATELSLRKELEEVLAGKPVTTPVT